MTNYNISCQLSAIRRQEELGFMGRKLHSGFGIVTLHWPRSSMVIVSNDKGALTSRENISQNPQFFHCALD
jgi:hypothetical protein